MTFQEEWERMPFHEKLRAFPDRHPFVVKCLLGLMMNKATEVEFKHMEALLERMGYLKFETGTELGDEPGDAVLVVKSWQPPPEDY